MGPNSLLILTEQHIIECELTGDQIARAVEDALVARRKRSLLSGPPLVLGRGQDGAFHAKAASDGKRVALKWFDYKPGRSENPDFWPMMALTDTDTGRPLALLDARILSRLRTAGITLAAAGRFASPSSSHLGFIACGAQARAHFALLRSAFPVEKVTAFSRTTESANRFVSEIESVGIKARAVDHPLLAIEAADIVVTSTPVSNKEGALDASWVRPGAFVSMPDLGWSWQRKTLGQFDFVLTDDLNHGGGASGFNLPGPMLHDLSMPLSARDPHRRTALLFAGTPIADLAVANLVFEMAIQRKIGVAVPL